MGFTNESQGVLGMIEKIIYADQWEVSSKYFHENDCYKWMADQIGKYKTVLEIGCGTGYSTLELLRHGHKVISIDKNEYCIERAKQKIESQGFLIGDISNNDVTFIIADIVDENFSRIISDYDFDVVICWNIGTHEEGKTRNYYKPHLLKYGLTEQQVNENWESSYAELILWIACKTAANRKVPFHLIDRSMEGLNSENSDYYCGLGGEGKYKTMKVDQIITSTVSNGGRALKVHDKKIKENIVQTFLISIMYFDF